MSGSENEVIYVRSVASTNGVVTCAVGGGLVLLGAIAMTILPELFFLAGVLVVVAGIIGITMGIFKLREPRHSLGISRQEIVYYHRRGSWVIPWDNVQRVDVPKVYEGLILHDLEMVGIRLKDPEAFLESISPRLITHLLMEQRPLIGKVDMANCQSGKCYGDDLIEDTKYKMKSGKVLTGISAMFANRMRKLQSGLGFDLYLSANDLDRPPQEFVQLLKECQESRLENT